MNYDTYIFDLDGTLLDSLTDLAISCNYALRINNMPERTIDEVRCFVGNGVKKLMERAIPNGLQNPAFEKTYADFRQHYLVHNLDNTKPYPGIIPLLKRLHREGKIGERENIRKKPAPDTVFEALRQLDASSAGAVYIGDSDVDVMTARNCNIPCISVLWGFRTKEFLIKNGATTFVTAPDEIF